jgi:hypothetical protein
MPTITTSLIAAKPLSQSDATAGEASAAAEIKVPRQPTIHPLSSISSTSYRRGPQLGATAAPHPQTNNALN